MKTVDRFLFYILCMILISIGHTAASDKTGFQWKIGEELTYKVKWSFIRLGTLKMSIVDTVQIDGLQLKKVNFYIDSNPMIFFVNMHNVYESYIDDEIRVHLFYAEERIDGVLYDTEYRFNYVDRLIHVTMTDMKDTTKTIRKNVPFDVPIRDGTSMIFYARNNAHRNHKDTLYSIYEAEVDKVVLNFTGKNEEITLINNEKIPSHYVDGELLIKGIAGVTGPYSGWFSTDSQRVPLKAYLKVFIGSVKVELESWKNWLGTEYEGGG